MDMYLQVSSGILMSFNPLSPPKSYPGIIEICQCSQLNSQSVYFCYDKYFVSLWPHHMPSPCSQTHKSYELEELLAAALDIKTSLKNYSLLN